MTVTTKDTLRAADLSKRFHRGRFFKNKKLWICKSITFESILQRNFSFILPTLSFRQLLGIITTEI